MKKLLIVLVLGSSLAVFAQENVENHNHEKMEKKSPEERHKEYLDRLVKKLSLDENQRVQIAAVLKEKARKMEEIRTKVEEIKAATESKMKTILKSEQYKEWQSFRKEAREKMEKKREHRKKNREQRGKNKEQKQNDVK